MQKSISSTLSPNKPRRLVFANVCQADQNRRARNPNALSRNEISSSRKLDYTMPGNSHLSPVCLNDLNFCFEKEWK